MAQQGDILQARMANTNKALLINEGLDGKLISTGFILPLINGKSIIFIFQKIKPKPSPNPKSICSESLIPSWSNKLSVAVFSQCCLLHFLTFLIIIFLHQSINFWYIDYRRWKPYIIIPQAPIFQQVTPQIRISKSVSSKAHQNTTGAVSQIGA